MIDVPATLPVDVATILRRTAEDIHTVAAREVRTVLTEKVSRSERFRERIRSSDYRSGILHVLEKVGMTEAGTGLAESTCNCSECGATNDDDDDEEDDECSDGSQCCGYCGDCEAHHDTDDGGTRDQYSVHSDRHRGSINVCTSCRHVCEDS